MKGCILVTDQALMAEVARDWSSSVMHSCLWTETRSISTQKETKANVQAS